MKIQPFSMNRILPYVLMGLVAASTLVFATSLASLHMGGTRPGYSAAALFNQGNAAAQQGRTGQTIVNYERAQLLAPTDADIAANLKWVRDHAGLTSPTISGLDRAIGWASPNTLAMLGWIGILLTGAGVLSARFSLHWRTGACFSAFAGISLLILSGLSAVSAWQKSHEAVIVSTDVAAKVSPVTNGETCFKLRPGEIVSVAGHYNDFALVKNGSGKSGWVSRNDLTPIIPATD